MNLLIEIYLGDGVYASFDGYYIVLDLRGQDNTTRISLEPPVFDALVLFKERVHAAIKDEAPDLCKVCGGPMAEVHVPASSGGLGLDPHPAESDWQCVACEANQPLPF